MKRAVSWVLLKLEAACCLAIVITRVLSISDYFLTNPGLLACESFLESVTGRDQWVEPTINARAVFFLRGG